MWVTLVGLPDKTAALNVKNCSHILDNSGSSPLPRKWPFHRFPAVVPQVEQQGQHAEEFSGRCSDISRAEVVQARCQNRGHHQTKCEGFPLDSLSTSPTNRCCCQNTHTPLQFGALWEAGSVLPPLTNKWITRFVFDFWSRGSLRHGLEQAAKGHSTSRLSCSWAGFRMKQPVGSLFPTINHGSGFPRRKEFVFQNPKGSSALLVKGRIPSKTAPLGLSQNGATVTPQYD